MSKEIKEGWEKIEAVCPPIPLIGVSEDGKRTRREDVTFLKREK